MTDDLKDYLEEIEPILKEIDRYNEFKRQLLFDLKRLNKQYESEAINYVTYKKLKEKLLSGKTKEENIEYFNAYILSLVKKTEYINTQVFSLIYNYQPEKNIILHTKTHKQSLPQKKEGFTESSLLREKPIQKPADAKARLSQILPNASQTRQEKSLTSYGDKTRTLRDIDSEENALEVITAKAPISKDAGKISDMKKPVDLGLEEEAGVNRGFDKKVNMKDEISKAKSNPSILKDESEKDGIQNVGYEYGVTPKPFLRKPHKVPKPRRKSLKSIAKSTFGIQKKEDMFLHGEEKEFGFKGILNFGFIKDFFSRIRDKENVISKDTIKEKSLLDFQGMAEVDFQTEARSNPNLLIKQASQLKELLKRRKINVYNPSMIGTLANLFVRRFSIYLIDNFPEFFKKFYLSLRYANVKILSNTYVNIMVFFSIISSMIFGVLTAIYCTVMHNPLFLIISKTLLMSTLGIVLCAGFMIYYPNIRIQKRIKSINTNLPFAIDHMSSIVASGVPPSSMFRLLAESKEYGEISLEIEKASNFIDVFGYDLLTAIKSVSSTTPSLSLKEFFDGLVSTIETGGSLKNYLSQKSQEAMTTYKIERQKYVETISTYSDIYTGVLIAAPLFFVSALSLVSILGGKIGGFDVETVIAFGTYVIIPLMNIAFIVFLEFNQPEI